MCFLFFAWPICKTSHQIASRFRYLQTPNQMRLPKRDMGRHSDSEINSPLFFELLFFWIYSFFWLLFLYLQMGWSFRAWGTSNQRAWRAKRCCSGPPLCCRIRPWVTSLSSWDPLLPPRSMWDTEFCWQWHLRFLRPCFMETWPTNPKSSE